MKYIKLTQGKFAIVDDENFGRLNQWKWCACWDSKTKSFYAKRAHKGENGKWSSMSIARQILGLKHGDKRQADHIDHDTLNNQISNIRIATNQQNHFGRRKTTLPRSSKYKGVCFDKINKKWRVYIMCNGKQRTLGRYLCEKKAAIVYDMKAKELFGEFAYTNF